MSTIADEVEIDIAALDAEAAKKATNGADPTGKGPDLETVTVEKTDPTPPAAAKTVVTPEEGLQKLQKQLEEERAARLAAENRASEAAAGEAKARGDVQTTQLDLIKGAIEQVTQLNDSLESQYADALTAQDFKAAAKVQRQMADNSAKLAQLESGKKALESAPKPVPRTPPDMVEQFCSTLTPQSAAWVRAHPDYVRDPAKNRKMLAAHSIALADGNQADTPAYFKSIEETLKIGPIVVTPPKEPTPAGDDDDPMASAAAKPVNGSRAPAAAPVSRSGNGTGSRPNVVKLTASEVEMAHATFPELDPKKAEIEYARNKIALKKEGKLS